MGGRGTGGMGWVVRVVVVMVIVGVDSGADGGGDSRARGVAQGLRIRASAQADQGNITGCWKATAGRYHVHCFKKA